MTTKIYTLTDPITHQVRYVGKSNNPTKRYYKHLKESSQSNKTHKNNWINKLLINNNKPILNVIDEVPISEWVFWEHYWISQFRAWGFNLTNSTDGGDGSTFGNRTSFKKGQKAWNKGIPLSNDIKEKLRNDNLGKKHSDETKEKMSITQKKIIRDGKILIKTGEKTRFKPKQEPWNKGKNGHKLGGKRKSKPVQQFSLDGVFIAEFLGALEASNATGINSETIRKTCIGLIKKPKKYIWKFKN